MKRPKKITSKYAEALKGYRAAKRIFTKLVTEQPENMNYIEGLFMARWKCSKTLLIMGRPNDAIVELHGAADLMEKIPEGQHYERSQFRLMQIHNIFGDIYMQPIMIQMQLLRNFGQL